MVRGSDGARQSGLRALGVESLRNLRQLRLETDASVVVITGGNGAGKTTVLEAVYLLVRGKSFRGQKAGPLCTTGERRLSLRGRFDLPDGEPFHIRFERDRSGTKRVFDPEGGLDQSSGRLPVQIKLVSENAQLLLDGEPELRRRLLDWNVFHVEPRFARVHRDFRRTLAQRNAALKGMARHQGVWDSAFAQAAGALTAYRHAFFTHWRGEFLRLAATLPFLVDCDLRFDPGCPAGLSLEEAMAAARADELERGFTVIGPSRADLYIARDGRRIGFSRGQTKAVVALLQLAAEAVHRAHGRAPAIFLLDDFEAELDEATAGSLWEQFSATASQLIATRVTSRRECGLLLTRPSVDMFHVEHGVLTPTP
ncbi:DNA replication/repair protein RecF [Thiocystis violacea]|uniref:DNA replication/repair protein RecF n=1 Tax=Thiocystis violacea TaxID=13725 RepID=UPI0019073DF2|nr:hypothetical protein [Thiocystis violacea]